jgi:single-stranded-DNA-specific exonuclease
MFKRKKWLVKAPEPVLQFILSKKLGISPLMAQLLINRGIYTVAAAREFLDVSLERLHPPGLLRGMARAVEITAGAIEHGEKILVYGDYDVDGVTGTALLVHVLRRLGAAVDYYIPHRIDEGYGLHAPVLHRARESGVGLVITVDCGISAAAEVEESYRHGGPEVIITDHHEPPPVLPPAGAVINPKQAECRYPFKELAGVGVAFKLVQALLEKVGKPFGWEEYLDLVCLGTVADIVPLHGENRILVRHGLPHLARSPRPGLQALCQVAGVKEDAFSAWDVGFILAPRLNAAGRLGDAGLAVELLLSDDPAAALDTAVLLNKENQERQKLENAVLSEALGMLEGEPGLADREVLVLASEHWHPGVIGIVASRLVDRFYKPVLLIACAEGRGKGSARSIEGFHLYQALEHCSGLLDGFGGHAMAAGFALPAAHIDCFRDRINDYAAKRLACLDKTPTLELDALVSLQNITYDLIKEIEQLAPHGHGNPGPVFGLERAKLVNCRGVGKNNAHLKMLLADRKVSVDGIGFNLGRFAGEIAAGHEINVAFTPSINNWQGRQALQIQVKDIHLETLGGKGCSGSFPEIESLKSAGDLIFVPETLLALVRDFLSNRGHAVPPEMGLLNAAILRNCAGEPLPQCPAPACEPRESVLARLNFSGGRVLVLANHACHTLQLFRHINDYNPHLAGRATCLHGFMTAKAAAEEMVKINNGEYNLVVATAACLYAGKLASGVFDRVLLAWPPVTEMDWRLVNELAGGRIPAIAESLFMARDWDDNRKHLEELAPERDVLAHYYSLLRLQAHGGSSACSKASALEQMGRAGYRMASCISLVVAAAVFADLGLLQYSWQEDMLVYKLLPLHGRKMQLADSPTYVWTRQVKSEGLKWIKSSAE